ncbi:MAG: hypothetical protein ACRCXT_20860 [Paraclostridium sp.]
MKIWKDINEAIKPTEVPKKLWGFESEMKKKPNFEHSTKRDKKVRKKKGKYYDNKR